MLNIRIYDDGSIAERLNGLVDEPKINEEYGDIETVETYVVTEEDSLLDLCTPDISETALDEPEEFNVCMTAETTEDRNLSKKRKLITAVCGTLLMGGLWTLHGGDAPEIVSPVIAPTTTAEISPQTTLVVSSTQSPTTSMAALPLPFIPSTSTTIETITEATISTTVVPSETTLPVVEVESTLAPETVPPEITVAVIDTLPAETLPTETVPVLSTRQEPVTISRISAKNCPDTNVVVTLGAGLPYFDYLMGLSLTHHQSDVLLSGTNFPEKYGWDLENVQPGDKVCAPASAEQILSVYKSVDAITD